MRKFILAVIALTAVPALASQYETPDCYKQVPTSCSFNEMNLSLCNKAAKGSGLVFLLSQRIHIPGGNKFGSADGSKMCTVKPVKGTDPKQYEITIGD